MTDPPASRPSLCNSQSGSRVRIAAECDNQCRDGFTNSTEFISDVLHNAADDLLRIDIALASEHEFDARGCGFDGRNNVR
jgi:hypothetical protein